jgi:hypothetical protein
MDESRIRNIHFLGFKGKAGLIEDAKFDIGLIRLAETDQDRHDTG